MKKMKEEIKQKFSIQVMNLPNCVWENLHLFWGDNTFTQLLKIKSLKLHITEYFPLLTLFLFLLCVPKVKRSFMSFQRSFSCIYQQINRLPLSSIQLITLYALLLPYLLKNSTVIHLVDLSGLVCKGKSCMCVIYSFIFKGTVLCWIVK